ncbi:MAG: hypothetical protein HKO70_00760, partial [Acidimicrobiia bacterium]|nr:hypothetical protein [Acidimicrobiia bacterium]
MAIGLVVLLILIFGVGGFVLWIWSIIDAVQRPDAQWERAGQTKLVWILILIFLGFLGSLIYLFAARPQLEAARDDTF